MSIYQRVKQIKKRFTVRLSDLDFKAPAMTTIRVDIPNLWPRAQTVRAPEGAAGAAANQAAETKPFLGRLPVQKHVFFCFFWGRVLPPGNNRLVAPIPKKKKMDTSIYICN